MCGSYCSCSSSGRHTPTCWSWTAISKVCRRSVLLQYLLLLHWHSHTDGARLHQWSTKFWVKNAVTCWLHKALLPTLLQYTSVVKTLPICTSNREPNQGSSPCGEALCKAAVCNTDGDTYGRDTGRTGVIHNGSAFLVWPGFKLQAVGSSSDLILELYLIFKA
jgi:hypothetical protein